VTLVGAGITLHEAMKAADILADEGIGARVIDLYSVKPVDAENLLAAGRETGAIVTVEDHFPEGGLGDAVLDVFAEERDAPVIRKLAVRILPGSGTPAEQLAAAGIDAEHIAAAARELAGTRAAAATT
jgi:transketolase